MAYAANMSAAALLFLIIYNFIYYFLYLVLFAFLVVTPIDLIQQAVQGHRKYDILIILVCYIVTVMIVAFIYASRLYISRSVLASIPKHWVPVEKGDVPPDVRQMIVDGLARSAAIAYEARPRVPIAPVARAPAAGVGVGGERQASPNSGAPGSSQPGFRKSVASEEFKAVEIPQHRPVGGDVEHPGWASPLSHDLPSLQYDTVVSELPNLIEAKAITLAPPDPESQLAPPALDPDAVALLQKPEFMGLREYLMCLTDLAVLAPLPATSEFLAQYEAARFSGRPLSNDQFRSLMHLFSDILQNMHPLSPAALAGYEDDSSSGAAPSESDIDNDAPRGTSPSSLGTGTSGGVDLHPNRGKDVARRGSSSTFSSGHLGPGLRVRNSSANTWQFRTAPTTPKSRHTGFSRASSSESFAHTRRPYPASEASSARSVGGGSVIRLAGSDDVTDLPYVLTHSPSR
jgi:hypothetical protein